MTPRTALRLAAKQAPRAPPRAPAPHFPSFTRTRLPFTPPLPRPTATPKPQHTLSKTPIPFHPRYYIQPPQGKPRAPSSHPNPSTTWTSTTVPTALPLSSLLKPALYRLLHAMYPAEDENGRVPRPRWYFLLLKVFGESMVLMAVWYVWVKWPW